VNSCLIFIKRVLITHKAPRPLGQLRARLAHADGIGDPLSHCLHLKTPVEKEAEATQITLGIFVEIEGMESAAETGFQVAQQDVDPAKLGEIIGMTPTG